jgi:hypothetical protein
MWEPYIALLIEFGTPILISVFILAIRGIGNRRVLIALALWTAAWYGSVALLPDAPERAVRVLLTLVFGIAFFWQERFGFFTVGGPEAEADRLFRRVSPWLREKAGDSEAALALASSLAPGTFPVTGGEWAVAAELFRQSLLRRAGVVASTLTPVMAFDAAARSFWRAGLERGLIGRRHRPSAWDEGAALRCYSEEFRALIPRQALEERPLIPLGGWDIEAERVVDALSAIPLNAAAPTRDAMVATMRDTLALARGDRSEEAFIRRRASAEQLEAAWKSQLRREQTPKRLRRPLEYARRIDLAPAVVQERLANAVHRRTAVPWHDNPRSRMQIAGSVDSHRATLVLHDGNIWTSRRSWNVAFNGAVEPDGAGTLIRGSVDIPDRKQLDQIVLLVKITSVVALLIVTGLAIREWVTGGTWAAEPVITAVLGVIAGLAVPEWLRLQGETAAASDAASIVRFLDETLTSPA